jgi:DNA-binding NarL/FixJ family response regulator
MDASPIRVMLIDDHPVVRQGLRSLLSQYPDIDVAGEADGGTAAVDQVVQDRPDVVLLDIRLAGPSGLELARQIRRSGTDTRVIILTSHDDEAYLMEAAQAGVHGFLLKNASAELLAEAIRAVHAGERRLTPALVTKALEQLEALSRAQAQAEFGLSDQELRLLQLLSDGASTQDMATSLYLSERTVKRKVQDVLSKLGASSRAQAVATAFKRGLL